jgi:hypothetical protein
VSGSFDDKGRLDIADGRLLSFIGKKRSGKSVMALSYFMSYPGDKIVLDIAGDDGPTGKDIIDLEGNADDLPRKWPDGKRDGNRPMTLRYTPDAGSSTYVEDMDQVVALAMTHGNCCLLIHEMGDLAQSNRTPPHTRRMLRQNRHRRVTALMCSPRPQTMDPLVLQQSDVVYVFETMNPHDRRRIADSIGWDPRAFDESVHALGPHEYLRFDSNELKPETDADEDPRLVHFDALPEPLVRRVERYARGQVAQAER